MRSFTSNISTNALNKIRTIKYNSWQVSNPYMFQHHSAILTEFTKTREYKYSTLI
jgi:hypothetical protein